MDYFNPTSLQPQVDFKPTGALAGQVYADQVNRSNTLMDMFQSNYGADLAEKQQKLSEFMKDIPVRNLQSQAQGATAQGIIDTAGPMAAEKLRQEKQLNDLNLQKMPSLIQQEAIKARAAGREEDYNQILQDLSLAAAHVKKAGPALSTSGPLPLNVSSEMDMSHPMNRMIANSPDPSATLNTLALMNPKHIQQMAEQTLKNQGRLADAKEHTSGSIAVANIQDRSRRDLFQQNVDLKTKMATEDKRMEQLWNIVHDETQPMKVRQEAKNKLDFILQRRFSEKQAGAGVGAGTANAFVPGQGIPVPQPVQVPNPGQQQGQQPQLQPDGSVHYGTYKFPNQAAFNAYKAAGGQ